MPAPAIVAQRPRREGGRCATGASRIPRLREPRSRQYLTHAWGRLVVSIDLSTFGSRLATVLGSALATVSTLLCESPELPGRAPAARLIVGDSCDSFPLP